MFCEYKDYKNIDVPTLSKILLKNRPEESGVSAIVFEGPNIDASVAVVEFDLLLAFKFLVEALADASVPMDAYLAEKLYLSPPFSFKEAIMTQFVKFRRLNGLEITEDEDFHKTNDIGAYIIEEKCEGCGKVVPQ